MPCEFFFSRKDAMRPSSMMFQGLLYTAARASFGSAADDISETGQHTGERADRT